MAQNHKRLSGQKRSESVPRTDETSPSPRCLRSGSKKLSHILVSRENKLTEAKDFCERKKSCSPVLLSSDSGIDSPGLQNFKKASKKLKRMAKATKCGRRSITRCALKVFDYDESDPELENRATKISKKKSHTQRRAERQVDAAKPSSKRMRLNIPVSGTSVMHSRSIDRKSTHQPLKQNSGNVPDAAKTDAKKEESPQATLPRSVPNVAKTDAKKEESPQATLPRSVPNVAKTDAKKEESPQATLPRSFAAEAKAIFSSILSSIQVERCNVSLDDHDPEVTVNFNVLPKQTHCGDVLENKAGNLEENDAESLSKSVLTSTPEKYSNSSLVVHSSPSSLIDLTTSESAEITLYVSPEKLSPIKSKVSPASSDSCYWDEFSPSHGEEAPFVATSATPIKEDSESSLMKSSKAYHTPHQFRRYLFKDKSKKTPQKQKSRFSAEAKLDAWASVMNNHFQEIEDSDLVVE